MSKTRKHRHKRSVRHKELLVPNTTPIQIRKLSNKINTYYYKP